MITVDPREGTVGPWQWCRVCGEPAIVWNRSAPDTARCRKHVRSDGCAIEGCTRSTGTGDGRTPHIHFWVCGDHWRRVCPPRSRRRRAYNAFFRRAKDQGGFDDALRNRFWRFFLAMTGSYNKRASNPRVIGLGEIDMRALEQAIGPIAPEEIVIR